ncbi:mevalonate kinase [Pendulispora brunnea]|uniref:mevalonate kinase n=1 Tax=Pendulispora brunnea TaxID=2905690 RepID=A0ABZ2JYG0_9BACT
MQFDSNVARGRGKIILLGEHAVVYGAPALAVAIERGASATARPSLGGISRLRIPSYGLDTVEEGPCDHGRAFGALVRATKLAASMEVEADVELPGGGGLGSSAALGVAVARALDPHAGPDVIAARVMAWERVFHGNASGVDAAISARGGCILFRRGAAIEPVHLRAALTVCVGYSGAAASTKAMIESVIRLRERHAGLVDAAFDAIPALVHRAHDAIRTMDLATLGRLMNENHEWLARLRLSTPQIERLRALAHAQDAFGAKLTGSGGGGCVVALVEGPLHASRVLDAWQLAGFDAFSAHILPPPPVTEIHEVAS